MFEIVYGANEAGIHGAGAAKLALKWGAKIGCGLAGLDVKQIAPMFKNAPKNCILPKEFQQIIKPKL